ncbi:hypothetical protein AB0D11_05870 [Streptomyces monashensis]|uniref:hypothetical protein n=1 Tax=Streptomyces monashensis TaxID=1678012 RepID=UPI0033E7508B
MRVPIRRHVVALTLSTALLAGTAACGTGEMTSTKDTKDTAAVRAVPAAAKPSPTSSAERQKLAKTRFVANAALAAGATYQWIVKPWKAGKFKKGAHGRRTALVKAALAGTFTYNRLKAAKRNAEGDPALAKALAPLSSGIDALKNLPAKLKNGDAGAIGSFNDTVNKVKDAGAGAGAPVQNKVPSAAQLTKG